MVGRVLQDKIIRDKWQFHAHRIWSRCNQGELALQFLLINKSIANHKKGATKSQGIPEKHDDVWVCGFREFRDLP